MNLVNDPQRGNWKAESHLESLANLSAQQILSLFTMDGYNIGKVFSRRYDIFNSAINDIRSVIFDVNQVNRMERWGMKRRPF